MPKEKTRKRLIILTPFILLVIALAIFIRTYYVWNGDLLPNVLYKSTNLIVQELQHGNRNLIILGAGGSLSVDSENKIVEHDPTMTLPDNFKFQNATVMTTYYPFECKGLAEAGKDLSTFINSIAQDYESITLIGHSKCGACFANAAKWIKYENLTIITISAPFKGTIAADEKAIAEKLNWLENRIYQAYFSNHKVDQDIMPNSEFIRNADYSGLQNCTHINVISECPVMCINPVEFLCSYLDKAAEIYGDGIVSIESQSLTFPNTTTLKISATHATSLQKGLELLEAIFN